LLKALGQASLPLGLLCVGARFEFECRRWLDKQSAFFPAQPIPAESLDVLASVRLCKGRRP